MSNKVLEATNVSVKPKVNNVEAKRVDINKFSSISGVVQLVDAIKDGWELNMEHPPKSTGNNIIVQLVKSTPVAVEVLKDETNKETQKVETQVVTDEPLVKTTTTRKTTAKAKTGE